MSTEKIYYVHDGHGSVRALTDPTGTVTDTYDYDAFGNLIHSTGSTPNNYLFAGEQFDPDLGLYYNRARYLNVSTGRFWSMDTLDPDPTDPFSLHRYLYVDGSPVDGVDPTGHDDLGSISVAEGISEQEDASAAEADFTAKKALSAKVIDIYNCEKFQAYIIPFHCYVYANQPGDWGFRYDIGADASSRTPKLILQSVSGFLTIEETRLADVRADANANFSKEASLSELGWVEWQSILVADFEFIGVLDGGIKKYATSYSFNTLIPDAVNCVFFTQFAIFTAKRLQNSGQ